MNKSTKEVILFNKWGKKKISPSQWEPPKKTENFHLNGIITAIFSLTKIPVVHVCSLLSASAYLRYFASQCSHHLSISGWSSGVNRIKARVHFIQKRTFMHPNCYYLDSIFVDLTSYKSCCLKTRAKLRKKKNRQRMKSNLTGFHFSTFP